MNNKLTEIQKFCFKIGKEIYENGELSPSSRDVLRSISIHDIRQHREEFQQAASQQIRKLMDTNNPAQQDLLNALMNCQRTFSTNETDHFIKDIFDILRLEKGNTLIKKLLARFSDYLDSYVVVEDTSELDDATYQQMRSGFNQIVDYVKEKIRSGGWRLNKEDEIKGMKILRSVSAEDIQEVREKLRKFALKALDTEPEIYTQIPQQWRAEAKRFLKSTVNLLAGVLDEDLIYDCLQTGLDAADKSISDKEAQDRIIKRLAQQLNQWARQGRFYVKKVSSDSPNEAKFLTLIQQSVTQLNINEVDNSQIQQLQAEISRLRQEIQDLKAEKGGGQKTINEAKTKNLQNQLSERQSQLEKIQNQGGKNQGPMNWHKNLSFGADQQQKLEQLAQKLEKIDQQQQSEHKKLSGGTIAWIVVSCLLGGGLIVSLLWFIFYKKKNKNY